MVSSSTHLHMPTALSSWPHIASASAFSVLNRTQYGAASRHLSIWNTACMGRRHNGTLVDSGQGWLFWTAVYQTHQMLCPSESLLLEQVVSKGNKHQPHSTSNMGGSSSPPLQLVSSWAVARGPCHTSLLPMKGYPSSDDTWLLEGIL